MSRLHALATAVIAAPAEDVYAVLADYRNGHPRILPREHFRDLVVEEGGQGAGTVIHVQTRVGGVTRAYRMAVTEPEPGRVLVESDTASTLVTTFTVTPADEGRKANVRIETAWDARPGLAGVLERLTVPSVLRHIYARELRLLAAYMQHRPTP